MSTSTFAASDKVAYTKILVSADGNLVLVCHYTAKGKLLFCDVNPGK
ncbi:MAG: hypothetical protein IT305_25860 [Chloroflexi bacterium]|nr:hypothetical protein [Chloroflexota bacterium]